MASSCGQARRVLRRAAGLLVLALVVGGAAAAADAAPKKIVVLDFTGGGKAAKVQHGVIKLLKGNAQVISHKAYVVAAHQVDGYKPDAAGVSRVARRLQAHGVITGKVSRHGRKYHLTLQVLEGKSGEAVGEGITVALKGGRLDTAARRKLGRELKAVIGDLPDPGQEGEADGGLVSDASNGDADTPAGAGADAADPAADEARQKAEEEDARRAEQALASKAQRERARRRRVASAGNQGAGDPEAGSVARAAADKPAEDTRDRGIDGVAGVSFVSRRLTFTTSEGTQALPQGYDGGLVPGVYAAADLYPMALLDRRGHGIARDFGISLVVDKVLLLKSKLDRAGDQSLPTDQTRYGAGLVYRWNFGSSSTSPTVKVSARYNKLSFSIDESKADDPSAIEIPDVSYTYVDPGIGLRLPLGEKVALLAEAHYIYVLDAGQFENADQYGKGSVFAFDADAGAELAITSNLVARAGARYMQYSTKLDGQGDLTDVDGDGMQDVTKAKDAYLGFYATAGLLF
ncbi:MAG TPA: hypothetical protein VKB80_29215 [Kofleriaceae bacterium]|nr:hypothetical protein [Kofleriaceae bacterium]